MKLFIFLFTLSSFTHAFTLNNNFGAAFKKPKVKVRVAGNSTCSAQTGVTIYELEDMIKTAINNYWDTVPTSSLRLKAGGPSESISNISTGRLCSPTDDDCIAGAVSLISPVSGIIIACNNDPANFNGSNVFAVSIPNNFSGKKITGAVILINDSSNVFSTLERDDKIAVIAHEIGHAIGLGHTEDDSALMYYKQVDMRRRLGQDDIDGVSYLYPKLGDACGLFGTIDTNRKIPPTLWQMGLGMLLMALILKMLKLFKILKGRSSLLHNR